MKHDNKTTKRIRLLNNLTITFGIVGYVICGLNAKINDSLERSSQVSFARHTTFIYDCSLEE